MIIVFGSFVIEVLFWKILIFLKSRKKDNLKKKNIKAYTCTLYVN